MCSNSHGTTFVWHTFLRFLDFDILIHWIDNTCQIEMPTSSNNIKFKYYSLLWLLDIPIDYHREYCVSQILKRWKIRILLRIKRFCYITDLTMDYQSIHKYCYFDSKQIWYFKNWHTKRLNMRGVMRLTDPKGVWNYQTKSNRCWTISLEQSAIWSLLNNILLTEQQPTRVCRGKESLEQIYKSLEQKKWSLAFDLESKKNILYIWQSGLVLAGKRNNNE